MPLILPSGSSSSQAAATTIGGSQLIYRYTVAGAAKASIDTGVDAPNAGSNDWTNGDLLEVFMTLRTDDVSGLPTVILNNDSTAGVYDTQVIQGSNISVSAAQGNAAAWTLTVHGSGGSANYPGYVKMIVPDFTGTTFYKSVEWTEAVPDATAANNVIRVHQGGYRSTSAIMRLKVAAAAGQNLVVGSQLLIYKRLAS